MSTFDTYEDKFFAMVSGLTALLSYLLSYVKL